MFVFCQNNTEKLPTFILQLKLAFKRIFRTKEKSLRATLFNTISEINFCLLILYFLLHYFNKLLVLI